MILNNSRPGSGLALAELSLEEESQTLKQHMVMLEQNRSASQAELVELKLKEEQTKAHLSDFRAHRLMYKCT